MVFNALHIYSGYSFLKSGLTINKIVNGLKKCNINSAAITDYNSLVGIAPFYNELKKNKLNPILGLDLIIEDLLLTLLIKNEQGYQNLIKINLELSKNTLNLDFIKNHYQGLIGIVSTKESKLIDKIGDQNFIRSFAKFTSIFEDFYIGLESYDYSDRNEADAIREFANKYTYQLVAFPFIKYEKKEDAIILKLVTAIENSKNLEDKKEDGPYYFRNIDELKTNYYEEEINNTQNIVNKINFELNVTRGDIYLYTSSKEESQQKLKELAYNGLKTKIRELSPIYEERLEKELKTIIKMGYEDYFLIVQDYCNFAKNKGILVGPGRGSAGGSLVAYALNICEVDPIKYNLLFERFLNEERQSMPDIDLDFEDTRREEVTNYIKEKYGRKNVSFITTTQNLGAKQALRDIGRIYQYPTKDIDLISKTIVDDKISLRDNYRRNNAFKSLIDSDKYYLEIVSLASKIEGLPRQRGLHAAGIIINKDPLEDKLPVIMDNEGNYIAEIEKGYLEDQGFYKMDILGLITLSVIKNCLNRINQNGKIAPNFSNIPHEDKDALSLINKNLTMGLFQLESPGMKKALELIKPETFEDVVALLALFRPGPMENIPLFAKRKNNKLNIKYLLPQLEPILAPTYGIIVYQEQIMQMVRVIAGFSFAEADNFRKAISKKDMSKMESLRNDFIKGAIKNGVNKIDALKVFDLIEKFANYGFNKSHSLLYAVFATRMAYLKYHYPLEFYGAILDNISNQNDIKFSGVVNEMKKISLKIAGPDINISTLSFTYNDTSLVFPLDTIKGLHRTIAIQIIEERNKNGKYVDFFDFVTRMTPYSITASSINKLIDAGAFDSLYKSRQTLRESVAQALDYGKLIYKDTGEILLDISFIPKPTYHLSTDDLMENLNLEFESLGMMISSSPLPLYKDIISKHQCINIDTLLDLNNESIVNVAGVVRNVKKIKTKKGTPMAFLEIYDDTNELRLTVFSDLYQTSYQFLNKGNVLIFNGKLDKRRNEFIVNKIIPLEVKNG